MKDLRFTFIFCSLWLLALRDKPWPLSKTKGTGSQAIEGFPTRHPYLNTQLDSRRIGVFDFS
jgi:hypothetical protein